LARNWGGAGPYGFDMPAPPSTSARVHRWFALIALIGTLFGSILFGDPDSYCSRQWREWFPQETRIWSPDATPGFQPTWGLVYVAPLPEQGAPWTLDRVEVTQGVVFDESSKLDPVEGFERGVWADVTVSERGDSCRIRFATARRWEGAIHFTSTAGIAYTLPVQVHAPWEDRGMRSAWRSWVEVLFLYLIVTLAVDLFRQPRATRAPAG